MYIQVQFHKNDGQLYYNWLLKKISNQDIL